MKKSFFLSAILIAMFSTCVYGTDVDFMLRQSPVKNTTGIHKLVFNNTETLAVNIKGTAEKIDYNDYDYIRIHKAGLPSSACEITASESISISLKKGLLAVSSDSCIDSVSVFDTEGRCLALYNPESTDFQHSIPCPSSGIIVVKALSGEKLATSKIIVK